MNRKVTFKIRNDEFDKFILAAWQEAQRGMRTTSIKLLDFSLSIGERAPFFLEITMESENYEDQITK